MRQMHGLATRELKYVHIILRASMIERSVPGQLAERSMIFFHRHVALRCLLGSEEDTRWVVFSPFCEAFLLN